MLRRRGAQVVHGPTVRTLPLVADAGIRAVTEQLVAAPPDVVIANTGIGVRSWFAAAESFGLGEALLDVFRDAEVLARGPKAAGAVLTSLSFYSSQREFLPPQLSSEGARVDPDWLLRFLKDPSMMQANEKPAAPSSAPAATASPGATPAGSANDQSGGRLQPHRP